MELRNIKEFRNVVKASINLGVTNEDACRGVPGLLE
jgi:hypothetical protein